jgi:hypothetical protein
MSAQFGRIGTLVVADGLSGRDLSQLHFKFQIKQFELQTPNTCQVRVYNVSNDTAQAVQKEYSRIIIQCGYQGGDVGTVFDGSLVQVRRGRESPVDTYLDLSGADGDQGLNQAVVNTALAAGSTAQQRLGALQGAMAPYGVTSGYTAPLPSTTLPRGKTMFGMARDHLRDLGFSTDTRFSIQNGQLTLLPLEGYLPDEAVVLTSATGLIGFPEQTQGGIMVKTLLNPKIKIGARVQIDNSLILQAQHNLSIGGSVQNELLPNISQDDGLYRVIVCEHSGDTRGNEWYSDMICIDASPGALIPQSLVPRLSQGYS